MPTIRRIAKVALPAFVLTVVSYEVFYWHAIALLLKDFLALFPEPAIPLLFGLALTGGYFLLCWLGPLVKMKPLLRYLWGAPAESTYYGLEPKDRIVFANDLRANRIQVITTLIQLLGGIAVLVGIYFAWANLKTTQTGQTETIRIANEGQITERFSKAIDQLGSDKLELRLGGIYSLESIANESEQYHWPIMEVLATYVRVHAPVKEAHKPQSTAQIVNAQSPKPGPSTTPEQTPSPDIQAILTILGRRNTTLENGKNEYLNLNKIDIHGANLNRSNLSGAHLSGAHLSGADLSGANLEGANLYGANLYGIDLTDASLLDADLENTLLLVAHLNGAILVYANLSGARLSGATLYRANLSRAQLGGAQLDGASLLGAGLSGANLYGANLSGAILYAADLRGAKNLTEQQIHSAEGNEDTKLPPDLVMPDSWKK